VFNAAAETRHDQPETTYALRCADLSKLCAEKARDVGCKKFVEVGSLSPLLLLSNIDFADINRLRL
jgi:hypothetical protein